MSEADKYFLRSRVVDRIRSSESESSFESTIMEDSRQSATAGEDHMNAIIVTLNALRASVEELRNSTMESQRDIVRLREGMQPLSENGHSVTLQPASGESSQVVVPATNSPVKLYDLPTFGGNAEEWPLFFANFNDTTEAFRYNHRQNLMRLQKCLVGSAKEAVASMLIYPDDVPNVLNELQFRFGRPDILVKWQLSKLQQFPTIPEHKPEQIVPFSTRVRNAVSFLKSAKCQHHLANVSLLEQMICKLPQNKQFDWAKHAVDIEPYPTIEHFSTWLSELARVVCLMPTTNTYKQNAQTTTHRRVMHIQDEKPTETTVCSQCDGDHAISKCDSFRALGVSARWEVVRSRQLCFACLRRGHNTSKCRSKKICGIKGCQRYHSHLLHNDEARLNTLPQNMQQNGSAQLLLNCRLAQGVSKQLFKILPVTLYGPNGKCTALAMFDEGSSITILEEAMAKNIGVKGQCHPLTLQWYDDRVVTEQSFKVTLEVGSCSGNNRFTLRDVRTVKNLNLPEQSFAKEDFEHLRALPLQDYHSAKPVLLIGLNQAYLGATTTIVQADADSPLAAKTALGWVAYGPTKFASTAGLRVLHMRDCQQLHQLVSDYFATDNFGINPAASKWESDADKNANAILKATTRLVDDRYETGLLWKAFPPKLPSSRAMAERRLLAVEKRMNQDAEFARRYECEMAKYVEKGYARKLTSEEIRASYPEVWYLPHFAVFNPNKPNKLRIVFDAAATVNSVSLNSVLLKGPEQAQPLIRILLQFRQGKIGVAADIREMFSQIKVRPIDQHVQRYLWRNGDSNQPIEEYIMTSMIFGAVCSPCIAEHVKNKNAERFKTKFPEATSTVIKKHYVDDLVATFDNPEEAVRICQQIVTINSAAGFELRDFISNCGIVQKAMNKTPLVTREVVNMEHNQATDKVLGMYWNTKEDTFEFHTKFHSVPQPVLEGIRAPTKRELLGIVMSVFDPFGLLADFLISPKIIIQDTWRQGIGWDELLHAELAAKWLSWWKEFQPIKELQIPRHYSSFISRGTSIELHIFVDASQVAFAAVGYFRMVHDSAIDVTFVMGKTRTAPKKLMSIPRLELQAAVLGTRLSNMLVNSHEFKISHVQFWSDSQTVLQWIHSSERTYKAFVGHRVAEILSSTSPEQWRWVPTKQNSADAATRPQKHPLFVKDSVWIKGPEFLKYDQQHWPTTVIERPTVLPEEAITSRVLLFCQASKTLIDFTKFNSYLKLARTVAWVIRAKKLFQRKSSTVKVHLPHTLTAAEIDEAEQIVCKQVQQECFADEIAELSSSRKVARQSAVYSLSPYLDESGLLRLSGRIDEATCLPFDARRPILLPPKHTLATLIVQHFHEKNHHQNSAVTINAVRQKFWITHIKTLLKEVQRNCLICKIRKANPFAPMMGQLPLDRLTPFVRPFSYTGVDLFGPLNVTVGRRREKRWGVIFTCLTIRAAHIELADDLSTDAFILCLRNFINRRGTPVRIRSDNGTNFIGAQKELKNAEKLLDTDRIQAEATSYYIEWIFNCPADPSAGGCWERLIRIVKSLLSHTLREVAPRVSTLQSVLIEAENVINSRPLTDLPVSHEDDEPLTPNHFLIGCVNSTQTPNPVDEKICLRKQWRIAQNLKDRLWKRWMTEYLPQLICRSKWRDKVSPLQVNDLVLICEPTQPRSHWQKGRVTKVFPTKDGQVRVAEVRTSTGMLRRPATRLARLTIDGESPGDSRGEEC